MNTRIDINTDTDRNGKSYMITPTGVINAYTHTRTRNATSPETESQNATTSIVKTTDDQIYGLGFLNPRVLGKLR